MEPIATARMLGSSWSSPSDRHQEEDALALCELDGNDVESDDPANLAVLAGADTADLFRLAENIPAALILTGDARESDAEGGSGGSAVRCHGHVKSALLVGLDHLADARSGQCH